MGKDPALETKVRAWLNSEKNYATGLELFSQITTNRYLVRLMTREMQTPGSMFHTQYLSQMIHLLRLYINPNFTKNRMERVYIAVEAKKTTPAIQGSHLNKKQLDKEIKAWLSCNPRDYNQGLKLLCKAATSKKQHLLNELTAKHNARNERRLHEQLSDFIRQTI